jgi:hypothetical protein
LIADIADDGFQLKDLGNFGVSLGMDALGLVPVAGATSKWAKIGRTAARLAPRLMTIIATKNLAENSDEILKSLSKFGTDEKLTAQDWGNLQQAIMTVTGIGAGLGRRAKNNKYGNSLKKPKTEKIVKVDGENVVGLSFKDKNGNVVTKAFSGEDAKAIKAAEGDPKKINDIIKKYDELKDFEVVPNSKGYVPHLQKPWSDEGIRLPFRRDPKVEARNVYRTKNGLTTDEGFWRTDKKIDDKSFINSENIKKVNERVNGKQ